MEENKAPKQTKLVVDLSSMTSTEKTVWLSEISAICVYSIVSLLWIIVLIKVCKTQKLKLIIMSALVTLSNLFMVASYTLQNQLVLEESNQSTWSFDTDSDNLVRASECCILFSQMLLELKFFNFV